MAITPTPTKSEELEQLAAFVAAQHPRGYLAEILKDAAPTIAGMIRDDIAWPIGETLGRLHDARQELRDELAAIRKQIDAARNDLQTAERATARARAELDELRGCARKILQLN